MVTSTPHLNFAGHAPDGPTLRLVRPPLAMHVASSFESIEQLRDEWNQLAIACHAPPSCTFEWYRTWWRVYGLRRRAAILVFRDEEPLAGVIPAFIEKVRIGATSLRVARIIGCDHTPSFVELAVRDESMEEALDRTLQYLLLEEHCDAVSFTPAVADSPLVRALDRIAQRHDHDYALAPLTPMGTRATLALPNSFEAFVRGLSRNQRSNYQKVRNRFRDLSDSCVEIIHQPNDLLAAFEDFVDLHQRQWRANSCSGHFCDWPHAHSFHRELINSLGANRHARLLRLHSDRELFASQYAFVHGMRADCRLSARAPDAVWNRLAPGRLSLMLLLEHFIREGVRQVDLGIGGYEYKERLGAQESVVVSAVVTRPDARSRRRLDRFRTAINIFDVLYRRIWRRRLAPRILGPRRPFSRTWIRSRI